MNYSNRRINFRQSAWFFAMLYEALYHYMYRSDMTVAALELKGGRLDADTAFDQVKSGSQLAEQMAATCQVTEFYPIVLYGRNTNSMETRLFRKKEKRIAFRGRMYNVILEKCGAELRTIVNKQPAPPT